MDTDFLRQEAERLRKDPVFNEAIKAIRSAAIEKLVCASVENTAEILRLQSTVAVCDGIGVEMEAMIASSNERRPIKAV